MDKYIINGGIPLKGEVNISGAKNASVALLAATVLCDGVCRIENLPNISDVNNGLKILSQLGARIKRCDKTTAEIDCRSVYSHVVPFDMTTKMRASYYFIGSLLGRFGKAKVAPPGGCDFGIRPIDQHIKGFELLGSHVSIEGGMIDAKAENLVGAQIYFDVVSVGATINIILAAAKAEGITIIENAAKEPHIVDLANFLNTMGADIRGAGTDVIKIHGVNNLHGSTYSIIPDQIEAGTFMVAAAATGGDVLINNVIPKHLESITAKLVEAGANVEQFDEAIRVSRNKPLQKCNVKTLPHPGFPTDMQPQMCTLLCLAAGTSIITEGIWDNRFRYVEQLIRMGAQVQVDGKIAVIEGTTELHGAPVQAIDLRAGVAVLIAGLCAIGTTEIHDIYHIERGYENIIEKLQKLGADIETVTIDTEISMFKAQ